MKTTFVIACVVICCFAFTSVIQRKSGNDPVFIPPSQQRSGDAKAGYIYLTTGDYLRSGIPLSYFKMIFGKNSANFLNREGENKDIAYDFTVVKAANGESVVAPNCMQCH